MPIPAASRFARYALASGALGIACIALGMVVPAMAVARDGKTSHGIQRVNNSGRAARPPANLRSNDLIERPYAPAPLQPLPLHAVDPGDRSDAIAPARGDGRMSVEERRRLRREIDEAGRDVYRARR